MSKIKKFYFICSKKKYIHHQNQRFLSIVWFNLISVSYVSLFLRIINKDFLQSPRRTRWNDAAVASRICRQEATRIRGSPRCRWFASEALFSFYAADTDSYSAMSVEPLPSRISRCVISFALIHSARNQVEILECAIERTVVFSSSYIEFENILQAEIFHQFNVYQSFVCLQSFATVCSLNICT